MMESVFPSPAAGTRRWRPATAAAAEGTTTTTSLPQLTAHKIVHSSEIPLEEPQLLSDNTDVALI